MCKIQLLPLSRHDGAYVRVEGLGRPFRFRLGTGSIAKVGSEKIFMWYTLGSVGKYVLQFNPQPIGLEPRPEPIAILVSHFHWETGFLQKQGVTVDEKDRGQLDHPAGTPVLTWTTRNPEARSLPGQTGAAPKDVAAEKTQSTPPQNATPFAAHATLLHLPDHLLHFSVTGLDSAWTEDDLRWQVLRAALSYFPLDDT